MKARTKTVDDLVRRTYASLAHEAARRAMASVQTFSSTDRSADFWMERVERWLNKAGAHAAAAKFRVP
jgi:hypothetical protein